MSGSVWIITIWISVTVLGGLAYCFFQGRDGDLSDADMNQVAFMLLAFWPIMAFIVLLASPFMAANWIGKRFADPIHQERDDG